jgi:hypothetical protein
MAELMGEGRGTRVPGAKEMGAKMRVKINLITLSDAILTIFGTQKYSVRLLTNQLSGMI